MDLYQLLGVDRDDGMEQIKRAYRRLARRYHPDINPGDRAAAARFRQISQAYDVLTDPDRRRQYDERGVTSSDDAATFGFEGFDFSVEAVVGHEASTFGDLFGDVFRRSAQGGGGDQGERGSDLYATVSLTFDEAMRGGDWTITVTRRERCRSCGGTGRLEAVESRCSHCAGAGMLRSARGHMVFAKACSHCAGTGLRREWTCPTCTGHGLEVRSEVVAVRVPPGIADGDRLRVHGKGNAGRSGAPAGDLHVMVAVAPHPYLRRERNDLHIMVPVAVHEAALGARIEVPAMDGAARLKVPPCTQSGQRFRLRGRGAPSPRDGSRGDLIVEVRLVLPAMLDERSKELMREFGRINGENVREGFHL
jgi:molecular chaperone DnaJ